MLLSIVILSYNRPNQVSRILEKFVGFDDKRVQIIIKDDRSPRIKEIQEVYHFFKDQILIDCVLFENDKNIGYDLNLWSSFWLFDSDYIFLLSDDDYIEVESLPSLLNQISFGENSVYFTPYICDNKIRRLEIEKYDINKFSNVIYNSILFSGLIFHCNSVRNIPLKESQIKNSIYSQVIISSILIFERKGFGITPSGILFVGGDGENYFGKNSSAIDKEKLANRSLVVSNLNYQSYLLAAVMGLANFTSPVIYEQFLREYKIRLIGYLVKVRALGIRSYVPFIISILKSHANKFVLPLIFAFLFCFCPAFIAKFLYKIGVKYFRNDD